MAKRTLWNKPSAVSSEPQDLEEIAKEQRRYQAAWDDLSEAGARSFRRLLLVPAIWIAVTWPLSHLIDDNAAFGIGFATSIVVLVVLHYLRPIRTLLNFQCPRCGQPFYRQTTAGGSFRQGASTRSPSGFFDNWNGAESLRCANCGLPRGALPPDFYPPDTSSPAR